ncbi:cell filamentation protein [Mycolicibacterium doricum]|uniref:protein adenylyltransferase n=1 Tax=Mycolicibacterium doricum TaxID=126673 RepID=A0A7I7VPR1_9MYCO|nr:Fic family protein [Mycolicibacterium doricum]MCV7269810.1 Fic family protein [Mycolicibacterium doricum]BBZ06632.1 cell filamentation protein [Mycolicibacterium doricum]
MPNDRQAHAVAATLAAHRLEGWAPSQQHVEALVALAAADVSYEDYLAAFRSRYPPPQPRRRRLRLRRATPYLIPGTTVLDNRFGATDPQVLADLESVATAGRMVRWLLGLRRPTRDDALDVRVIHHHLFSDVYAWAGIYRTTELRRGEHGFAWQSTIAARMTHVHQSAREVVTACADHDQARLAYEFARIYADYNQIHPFREGNGRVGALLLYTLAKSCGRRLDLTGTTRSQWYSAAADSMPFRRDGQASHRPFLYLLGTALDAEGPAH